MQQAICVDLDGTLALFGKENPFDRDFMKDEVSKPVRDIILAFEDSSVIILFSGRKNVHRKQTEEWLEKNNICYDFLYMDREEDDFRKDTILKKEMYDKYIKGKYELRFVVEDRKQIKRFWVSEKIFVFDVNQTDTEY